MESSDPYPSVHLRSGSDLSVHVRSEVRQCVGLPDVKGLRYNIRRITEAIRVGRQIEDLHVDRWVIILMIIMIIMIKMRKIDFDLYELLQLTTN